MIDCAAVLRRGSRTGPLIVFAALICALAARAVEQNPCDQGLRPTSDAWGYRDVGGRCEGTYERLVGLLGPLQIAAVDAGPPQSVDDAGAILRLSWPAAAEASAVKIRASVLRDRLFFRMDANADRPPFQWPTPALEHFHVRSSELAVTASVSVGGTAGSLYLPIRFGDVPLTGNYRIVAVPPSELSELTVTLWAPTGGAPLSSGPLRRGFYPPRQAIAIPIALAGKPSGQYRIRLAGAYVSGGATAVDLLLLHHAS